MHELHEAVIRRDLQRIKKLLDKGANPNVRDRGGNTPLHWAAFLGYPEVIHILVERGADIDARDNHGSTPLHSAASRGFAEIVRVLVDNGANVNARNDDGLTPLHEAAAMGHTHVVHVLVDSGADVNARDNFSVTPLHLAAAAGYLNVARILVEKGADVNARGFNAWTPLHYAAGAGHIDVARFLLESGADPTALDVRGKNPADHAREKGHNMIAELIERWDKMREKAMRPQVSARSAETTAAPAQSTVETVGLLVSLETAIFVEGEWGVLGVKLAAPSSLLVEGDVDCLNLGKVDGKVELPVKPRKAGRLPLVIVASDGVREDRKLIWIDVLKKCENCRVPVEPNAKYCWNCGRSIA